MIGADRHDGDAPSDERPPTAFISYSWDAQAHKDWVKRLATRLREDGVNVTLDQWAVVPGDRIPVFMERAVRENDYVLVICTLNYKARSDARMGAAGYEGDIMTGELLGVSPSRKFIPVLRSGEAHAAVPSWLGGRYYVDLRSEEGIGDDYERQYDDLLTTLHGEREQAPPVGRRTKRATGPSAATTGPVLTVRTGPAPTPDRGTENGGDDPIRILGIVGDEVTAPRRDGRPGSGLYLIPLKLSRMPSPAWAEAFVMTWNRPPRFTNMHRSGIARVARDRIILDGTTLDEVKRVHRDTLKIVVDRVNEIIAREEENARRNAAEDAQRDAAHRAAIDRLAGEIQFD